MSKNGYFIKEKLVVSQQETGCFIKEKLEKTFLNDISRAAQVKCRNGKKILKNPINYSFRKHFIPLHCETYPKGMNVFTLRKWRQNIT